MQGHRSCTRSDMACCAMQIFAWTWQGLPFFAIANTAICAWQADLTSEGSAMTLAMSRVQASLQLVLARPLT